MLKEWSINQNLVCYTIYYDYVWFSEEWVLAIPPRPQEVLTYWLPSFPVGEINRVSPQCSTGRIDCSNLLMEMRGRRSTYWAIWRCYFDLGANHYLHQQSFRTQFSKMIIRQDTVQQKEQQHTLAWVELHLSCKCLIEIKILF